MKSLIITRNKDNKYQTLGYFVLRDNDKILLTGKTLELPWVDNKPRVSCVPSGEYIAKKRWSEKYKDHYEICDVPDRSLILIHAGNYRKDTKGCLLLGNMFLDIDGDKYLDILNSKKTLQLLEEKTSFEDLEVKIIAKKQTRKKDA